MGKSDMAFVPLQNVWQKCELQSKVTVRNSLKRTYRQVGIGKINHIFHEF